MIKYWAKWMAELEKTDLRFIKNSQELVANGPWVTEDRKLSRTTSKFRLKLSWNTGGRSKFKKDQEGMKMS